MEGGTIFIVRSNENGTFVTATQGMSILQLIASPNEWIRAEGFVCEQARKLFKGLGSNQCSIYRWWERLVDLTIVSHSSREISLAEVFNLTKITEDMQCLCPRIDVVREPWNATGAVEKVNALVVPYSRNQSGYDSRVTLLLEQQLTFGFYIHSKIQSSKDVKLAYSNSIINSVKDGVKRGLEVGEIHAVVYDWSIATAAAAPSIRDADVKARLDELEATLSTSEVTCVNAFIEGFLASNLHVISREEMKRWLIPSLVTIPDAILAFTE
jgi:hypothetical protein